MNLNEIKQLIDLVNSSDLQETIIEEGEFKITLRRSLPHEAVAVACAPASPAPAVPQVAAPAAAAETVVTAQASGLTDVCSPIVGTFYQASSPDTAPFVSVGDSVKKGDILCIIEAMKLMNEIEAEISGTVAEVLVENGQPIEYDQPLFRIKP
ncbi:acetyl-CoA carboxylase biotin carboxyl carrier protein [Chlorobium phaeovibrioides]|uniref:Biotin carboxyl carrier protein of acetyl-CoA carboxylase n=1 Tax=Chlorobium phaeovibrioides TaxID=1094 RepID=A0A432AWA0_CHLPH|nr:acetyl-CoA carboxylase biotin carboxyl carrier protein [Chlorobium phaeovibrioides]NQU45928.1 acetyl-CoA carboxylase biotin carboxyl carrier protein [Chlorobium sp.]KAA6233157.1 acetyl-CoA carboxylase biotin carboxyl carrier protein [Chlorobium phaeovibrioides]MWV53857.1 acetyl-CoA carboxylase biotin carboxyl carrier protein [Chlorobium phaeovibrioides]QEQ56427.1 acetyl-CoA carboxylase biotin carboxyl carrier protein [Chlorobium phaeovibrioides]RTY36551.1 acetyl-CoA carboxylase biotin carbo